MSSIALLGTRAEDTRRFSGDGREKRSPFSMRLGRLIELYGILSCSDRNSIVKLVVPISFILR